MIKIQTVKDKLIDALIQILVIGVQISILCLPLLFTICTGIHMSIGAWIVVIELIIIAFAVRE